MGSGEACEPIGGFLLSIVFMLDLTGVVIFEVSGCMFLFAKGLIMLVELEPPPLLLAFFTALWSLKACAYIVLNRESLSDSKRSLVDFLLKLYLLELPLFAAILEL